MIWANESAAHRHAIATSFAIFNRTPRDALLWLTTVIAAYVVTLDDDVTSAIRASIDSYHTDRRAAYRSGGRIRRNPQGWTRWVGAIEIDVIHPKIARMCSATKAGLLLELGIDVATLRLDQRILVVHEHAVIDHRGHGSSSAFVQSVRDAFPGARRVHAANLYTEGTVAQQLGNLAEYAAKLRLRYSIAWNGRRTSYLSDYEPEWKQYVRGLYLTIGMQKLLNANITTQASRVAEGGRMYAARDASVGEIACSEPLQLCVSKTFLPKGEDDDAKPSHHHDTITRPTRKDAEIMRAHEIIDGYVDPDSIIAHARQELENALARQKPGLSPDEIAIMYGDPAEDLRLEQQRLDIEKTRAEIDRIGAAAARDRAEARRGR